MNSLVLEQLFSGTSNKFWLYLHSTQVGAFVIAHELIIIWTKSVFFFFAGCGGVHPLTDTWEEENESPAPAAPVGRLSDGLFIVTLHNCIALLSHKI